MAENIKKADEVKVPQDIPEVPTVVDPGNMAAAENSSRDHFMANLAARRLQLKETLNYLKDSQREYDSTSGAGDYIDALDSAQREISSANIYSMIERKNRELRKVEQLMSRLANDEEFGICEECGEPIRQERLLIMPDATMCVPCQRELEKWNHGNVSVIKNQARWKGEKEFPWDDDSDLDAEDHLLIDIHGVPVSLSDDGDLDPENSQDGPL
jgi:DnaK suppressor protein